MLVLLWCLGMVSCKTALTDTTEYETGWEFDNPNPARETAKAKGNRRNNKKDNSKSGDRVAQKTPPATPPKTSTTPATPPKSNIGNASLKKEIDQWLGVPYKYGGTTKQGVDCSGFCGNVFKNVYNITLGRSAQDIYNQAKPVNRSAVKEGDLVFFKINSSRVSHVGIYLSENKFVHASTSRGVMISNLTEAYWTKYYFACGRVL